MNVLIVGANGFVGTNLTQKLLGMGHQVWGLVRNKEKVKIQHENFHIIEADLLGELPDLGETAFDVAYYLAHGMKIEGGDFEYFEVKAATHFAGWWSKLSGQKVIYLGGLGPSEDDLSAHLRSRQMVGKILALGSSCLEFRASIILGGESLSYEMIRALSERLPFRPELRLLKMKCQPLALSDLMDYLIAGLDLNVKGHQVLEIGGTEALSYGELLDRYAELEKLKRKTIKLPDVDSVVFTKLLDYVVPEYSNIGKKLVESLAHETIVQDASAKEVFPHIHPKTLDDSLKEARAESKNDYHPLWDRDFLKKLLSDKILTQAGLFSPEVLQHFEKVLKLKELVSSITTRKEK